MSNDNLQSNHPLIPKNASENVLRTRITANQVASCLASIYQSDAMPHFNKFLNDCIFDSHDEVLMLLLVKKKMQ